MIIVVPLRFLEMINLRTCGLCHIPLVEVFLMDFSLAVLARHWPVPLTIRLKGDLVEWEAHSQTNQIGGFGARCYLDLKRWGFPAITRGRLSVDWSEPEGKPVQRGGPIGF